MNIKYKSYSDKNLWDTKNFYIWLHPTHNRDHEKKIEQFLLNNAHTYVIKLIMKLKCSYNILRSYTF